MGVLPLEFLPGKNAVDLGLTGKESFTITGIAEQLTPGKMIQVSAEKETGEKIEFEVKARLDSEIEIAYYQNGGILQYVLRGFLSNK